MDEKGQISRSKKYNGKDNKLCPVMAVAAKIDGTYCVSQVVPDTKSKTIWVTSARIQKADDGSQVPNADNSPQPTSETPLASSSAEPNIPQIRSGVKESGTTILQRVEELSKSGQAISAEEAKAASGYGDYGAKVLTDFVNNTGGQSFSQVKGEAHNAYLAGRTRKLDFKAKTELQEAMFRAGLSDRNMSNVLAEKNKPAYVVFDGKESGAPRVNGKLVVPQGMSKTMATVFDLYGQVSGRKVRFLDNITVNDEGAEANARITDDGYFDISLNSSLDYFSIFGHEPIHDFKRKNPAEYQVLIDFAVQMEEMLDYRIKNDVSASTTFENIRGQYERAGLPMNATDNLDEIAARFYQKMVGNERDAKMLMQKAIQNRDTMTAMEKFMDAIETLIWKLQRMWRRLRNQGEYAAARDLGMTIAQLEHARKIWQDTLKASAKETESIRAERSEVVAEVKTKNDFSLKEKENLNSKTNSDIINDESEIDSVLNTVLLKVRISKVKMKTFPPYDKSKSDTNELSTRWAHQNDVKTGAQAIAFHKNECYIIEKFDDTDLKYIISGRISYQDYQSIRRELEENARTEKGKSAAELVVIYDQRNRQGNFDERGRQGADGSAAEYGRKNNRIQRMAEEQNRGQKVDDNADRSDEQNGGNREGSYLNEKSYSLKEEWHTDLTKAQVKMVEGWLRRAGSPEATKITDTANWYMGRLNGDDIFVIYSTEDAKGPTILYETRENAKIEKNILMDILEAKESGKSVDRKSNYVNWILGSGWLQYTDDISNNIRSMGTGTDNQDVGVLQRQSRSNASRALWNVIDNLLGKQGEEIPVVDYSLKDDVEVSPKRTKELLDTIAYLKEQMNVTKFAKADPRKLKTMTRKLLKEYSSTLEVDEMTNAMGKLYRYMANGEDGHPAAWDETFRRAKEIAAKIAESAVMTDNSDWTAYQGLRNYLRTTKMYVNPENFGDASGFHRRNFGRILVTTKDKTAMGVDEVFQELSNLYPEFFNEDKVGSYADKLYQMEEVLDSLKPLEFNPFTNDMDVAITSIANDVIQNFFAVPQAKPTFADRAEQRVAKARAEGKQLVAVQREKSKRALAKAREAKEKALVKEREKQKARLSKMSEDRRANVIRAQITRSVGSLSQKLVKATDKKHIPKELQEAVTALLYNINLESNYTYNPETGTYHKNDEGLPTNKTKAFRELKKVYQSIAERNDYGLVLAPELLGASDYGIGNCFDEVMELSDKRIADMTVEELTKVYDVVRLVEHSVLTAGKMFALQKWETLGEVGKAFQKSTATRRPKHALMESHSLLDIETPLTFFSHFGDAGNEFFRALRHAQDREQVMQNELTEVVNKVVSREFVEKAGKELYEFETMGGEKLTLSKAHIMNIYLLSKREQGLKHLIYDEDDGYFGNGIHQPKVGKIRRSAESIRLNKMDLGKILEVIQKDEEAKKICDGLQKATGLLAQWGNEASMRVFGYEKFKDPNYWTIKVASEGVHQTVDKNNDKPRSIKNMGSAKAVENKVSNSLEIDDVFTVFAKHSSDMLCYSAWLEIMEDASRLYNYQFLDDAGGNTGKSFQSMLDKYAGEGGSKYFFRLMGDIQNGLSAPADTATEKNWQKLYGNAQRAAVGGNLRVIVQQPTSLVRAAAVLNSTSILGAVGEGVAVKPTLDGWKKAVKYAPIAARKAVGGYEIGADAKGLSDEFYKPETTKGKAKKALSEAAFWGAGKADELTWGIIWNACEIEVNKNKSLFKGSQEYYNAVANLFTKVIDETQVVDGVLQRSQAMRTSTGLMKQMTAFTGEPTQGFNIVLRAYDTLRYETEPAKRTKAKKMLGRAVYVHVMTSITTALAASLVDAVRDDGEEEYWEKFWKAFSGIQGDEKTWFDYVKNFLLRSNVTDNLNPLSFIPLLKDFMSLAQGYNVGRMDASVIGDLGSATYEFVMTLAGEGKKTIGYAGWNVLLRGAKVFGKSPYNFIRDLEGVIRTAQVETGNLKAWYKTEKMRTKPSTNTDAYIDVLYKAYETDNDAYEYIYNDMIKSGVKASTIQEKMEEHMMSAEGVKKVEDLSKRYMPPAKEKKYDKSLAQISSSRVWKSANAEQKKEAKDGLYNFLTSTSEAMEKTRAEARAMGVDETEYTLWQLAKEMVNEDKESLNASEKAAAIELLDMGDAELAYFYNTETADKAYAGGVSMENFAKFKAAVSDLKGDGKKAKVLAYANQYAGNNKEWLFLMGSEYSSYKKRSDYISYFGK